MSPVHQHSQRPSWQVEAARRPSCSTSATPHSSAEERCAQSRECPAAHAHRVCCLAHHALSPPEPQSQPVAPLAAAAAPVYTTRPAQPTRRLSFAAQANTSAPRRSDRGAVFQAAALLSEEAWSPRASAALSCAAGLKRRRQSSSSRRRWRAARQCPAATPRRRRLAG